MGDSSNQVTLKRILHNKTKGALSRSVFFAYLKQYFAENVLEFWVVVQDFYNMFEPNNERSTYLVFNLEVPEIRMTEARLKEKKDQIEQIVLTFIADDSPLQINLPDMMRQDIMDGAKSEAPKDGLFDEAQAEAERLLESNYFYKFLRVGQAPMHKSRSLRNTHLSLRVSQKHGAGNQLQENTDPKTKRAKSEIEELVLEDTSPLDRTLDEILHLKTKGVTSRSALHGYLEKKGAGELIEYWVCVLNFYNAYEPENSTSSFNYFGVQIPEDSLEEPAKKMEEINKIYARFLAKDAERKVALSPEILKQIEEQLNGSDEANPPMGLFDRSQTAVQKKIENDFLQGFLQDAERRKQRHSMLYVPRPPPPVPEQYRKNSQTGEIERKQSQTAPPLPRRASSNKKVRKKGSFLKRKTSASKIKSIL